MKHRHPPARCPSCGETMTWNVELFPRQEDTPEGGYECRGCGSLFDGSTAAELKLEVADGRIRRPEDVAIRLRHAAEAAAADVRLSDGARAQLRLYHEVGEQNTSVQIAAADRWVDEQLGLHRSQVRRNRARLESLNYVKRIRPKDVTMYALKEWVTGRRAERRRVPVLLELRRGPSSFPTCAGCGGPIPDADRVSKLYCSPACRLRAHRRRLETLSDLS